MYIDDNAMQWAVFAALVLIIFCPLFVFVHHVVFKGERVAAGVVATGISLLVAASFMRNPELLNLVHQQLAFVCVGSAIATFAIIRLKK